jgi:uncharacterized repeat protein (TIGR03803 family)
MSVKPQEDSNRKMTSRLREFGRPDRPNVAVAKRCWVSRKGLFTVLLLLGAVTVGARAQTYTALYTFTGGADGGYPAYGGLIADATGNLYGTATFGGNVNCPPSPSATHPGPGCGVVFKLNLADNTETVLYTFSGLEDGSNPWSGVVSDSRGDLYGTTPFGGGNGVGVIFKVDPFGSETIEHTFDYTDGANPTGTLVWDSSGNLDGTTVVGGNLSLCGSSGCGVVFSQGPSGRFRVLHVFTGRDGANPTHGLIRDSAGYLYGATENGGLPHCLNSEPFEPVQTLVEGCGALFKLDLAGAETSLYLFNSAPDAVNPRSSLIQDGEGNFYGTTFYGGVYGQGTVFRLDSSGTETVLFSFRGSTDGANPWSSLVRDSAGNLYGTANHAGGTCDCGTVFRLSPEGHYTVLHTFAGPDGQYPGEPLLLYGGALYGMTSGGGTLRDGSAGAGNIFKITLP